MESMIVQEHERFVTLLAQLKEFVEIDSVFTNLINPYAIEVYVWRFSNELHDIIVNLGFQYEVCNSLACECEDLENIDVRVRVYDWHCVQTDFRSEGF